jgi:hypothetical protein
LRYASQKIPPLIAIIGKHNICPAEMEKPAKGTT